MINSYRKLIRIPSFEERFEAIRLNGLVGDKTFGKYRYINQSFYNSRDWISKRRDIIIRDNGCDLAFPDYPINGKIIVHHIEPITMDDIINRSPKVFDDDNLICVSFDTHNAIHFGDSNLLQKDYVERRPGDTCPWK